MSNKDNTQRRDNEEVCVVCGARYGLHSWIGRKCPKDIGTKYNTEFMDTIFTPVSNIEATEGEGKPKGITKVTRVEVIDHSPDGKGRAFVKWGVKSLELSYQDDGRTLKIFIK